MIPDEADLSKHLGNLSSRHHYIPRFLINGFANEDGMLYIYDKQKDEILRKPRSPKSIFFEHDRNTIDLTESKKTSVIEDVIYKNIDDRTSKIINHYQTAELSSLSFTTEETAGLLFFFVSLFWRIPKTDFAAENLMDNAVITSEGIDPETLRTDPTFRKLSRARLLKHHIDSMREFGSRTNKWHNVHENSYPIYVIGDYPILFRKHSGKFADFDDTDILFAVSSRRVYSSMNNKFGTIPVRNSWRYNVSIIDQSVRYVASGDYKALEYSVFLYKILKKTRYIFQFPEVVFTTS